MGKAFPNPAWCWVGALPVCLPSVGQSVTSGRWGQRSHTTAAFMHSLHPSPVAAKALGGTLEGVRCSAYATTYQPGTVSGGQSETTNS